MTQRQWVILCRFMYTVLKYTWGFRAPDISALGHVLEEEIESAARGALGRFQNWR